jgi:hypothetical protein
MQSLSRFQHSSSKTWKKQFSISHGKTKKPKIAKTTLNNKRTSCGITIPDLKLYYITIELKATWYCYKGRQVEQWI